MRRALLIGFLTLATVGVLAAVFGPALEDGDRLWPLAWVLWAPVGGLILIQRPGNRVGTAALAVGLAWGLGFGLLTVSSIMPAGPAAAWAELINVLLGVFPWMAIIWLVLVFPSGDYAGRAERIVGRALIGFGLLVTAGFAVNPAPMEETGLSSPLAVPALRDVAAVITADQSFLFVIGFVLAAIVLVVGRSRRSQGVERLQFRWLLVGALAFMSIMAIGQVVPEGSDGELLWILGGSAIPGAIGIAVLRYRLFEIDRIISRSVSYTVVVGFLAAVYVGGVTGLTSLLPDQSRLVVAATTLAVAALFNPVRRMVQDLVDRRFNRSRYDTQRVMDRFAGSLRDQVDSEEVVDGWVGVVAETMQPAAVGVWVREGS
ncbi:MAG: hypothetical protein WED83_00225 [Acidimicrobiia bacterium]